MFHSHEIRFIFDTVHDLIRFPGRLGLSVYGYLHSWACCRCKAYDILVRSLGVTVQQVRSDLARVQLLSRKAISECISPEKLLFAILQVYQPATQLVTIRLFQYWSERELNVICFNTNCALIGQVAGAYQGLKSKENQAYILYFVQASTIYAGFDYSGYASRGINTTEA